MEKRYTSCQLGEQIELFGYYFW